MTLPIVLAVVLTSTHGVPRLDYDPAALPAPAATAPTDPCQAAAPPDLDELFQCADSDTCPPALGEMALAAACYRRSARACKRELLDLRDQQAAPLPSAAPIAVEVIADDDPIGLGLPGWLVFGGLAVVGAAASGVTIGFIAGRASQ